jgi:peptide-methionine (S)-S-oxide reductase
MTVRPSFLAALVLFVFFACNASSGNVKHTEVAKPDTTQYGALDTATLASGCFWCVEAIFESLKGVKEVESGYAGGQTQNPTYEAVCSHTTGHTETVQIYYDPKIISFETLLEVYFGSQNPTQVLGQGPDNGDSYRSVIFYRTEAEKMIAEKVKNALANSGKYDAPIAATIQPFERFWIAEAYHQNYERLHPDQSYVRAVSIPRLNKMKAQFPHLLK